MRDMPRKNRIIIYLLLIIFFTILQSAPQINLVIFNIRPIFLITLTVCIGMFEREIVGGYLGLFAGICWDLVSSKPMGFYAILLLILGVLSGLIITNFMINNLMTAMILCGGALLFYGIICYIGTDFSYGMKNSAYSLWHSIIPQMLYSFVFVIPIYLFCRFLIKQIKQNEQ